MRAPRTLLFATLALAAVPLFVADARLATGAEALALVLAAIGLNIAAGYGGLPSLGQGAFAGLGAYAAALLYVRAGWNPLASVAASFVLASAAGWIIARGTARLRPTFVALSTWIASWIFAFAISAFPGVSGGPAGVVTGTPELRLRALGVALTLTPVWHYEIALAFVVAALAASAALHRRYAPVASFVRADPAAATAAGIAVARFRTRALVASAGTGGLAGALIALSAGVADPTRFGPGLSITLFVAVLLGGAATVAGPVAGIAAVYVVSAAASGLARPLDVSQSLVEPVVAGFALLALLIAGKRGIVRTPSRPRPERFLSEADAPVPAHVRGGALVAREVTVDYGALRALDTVFLDVAAGSCHAIVGPNGSGKTTLLRALSGALPSGYVAIDGIPLSGSVLDRAARGLSRTFQRPVVWTGEAIDHVLAGCEMRRHPGVLGALLRTPRARAGERHDTFVALGLLQEAGLAHAAHTPVESLSGAEQRLLQVVIAAATRPRVLLLDEPAAGLGRSEESRMLELLRALLTRGTTVVLVEHNMRLVRAIASRVTVLDAGRVVAEGSPSQIAANDAVREAYLGTRR